MMLLIFLLGLITLIIATYFDIKDREIPIGLCYVSFGVILIFQILFNNWIYPLISSIILFLVGFIFYKTETIGGGDVRLFLVIGISLPILNAGNLYTDLFMFLILSFISSISLQIVFREMIEDQETPFVPSLLISYLLIWLIYFI